MSNIVKFSGQAIDQVTFKLNIIIESLYPSPKIGPGVKLKKRYKFNEL